MSSRFSLYIVCVMILTSFFACTDMVPTKEVSLIDSLNGRAYAFRYRDLDSSYKYAAVAYREVNFYNSGKAEAANNLAFCAFMNMDFERAESLHKEVYKYTKNELELLIADVGLMKIYQRTAMNKEYYDYRNSALRRMKRIREESDLFADRHDRLRLNYAFTEFFIVSSVYYYYLQQRPEAVDAWSLSPKKSNWRTPISCFTTIILKGRHRLQTLPHPRTESCVSSMSFTSPGDWRYRAIIPILRATACKAWPT